MRFTDKTALITGGSTGIGLATAQALVDAGARVMVTGRTRDRLDAAQAQLGDAGIAVVSDTAQLADIEELSRRVRDDLGSLDLLFVNAGITRWIPMPQVREIDFDTVFVINVKGAYFTAQQLSPLIRRGGSIVFTTSVVDELGYPLTSVYAATKAAVRSMTRSFGRELLPQGIRVNAVSPGVIDTDVLVSATSAETSDRVKRQVAESNPMKRIGRPEEVAAAVLYLGFDATYTTGAELAVDGGSTQL